MKNLKITATDVQVGTTGAGGWDVAIEITGRLRMIGDITLLANLHNGAPDSTWAQSCDQWMSHELDAAIDRLPEDDRIEAREEIRAVAANAIAASGIDAAE